MPPVVIAGGIAAAGAVGAAAIGSHGASKAAKTQAASNQQSTALQTNIYNQNRAALQPWQTAGLQANSLLQNALGFGGPATVSAQTLPTQQANQAVPAAQQLQSRNALLAAKPWLEQNMSPNAGTYYMNGDIATQVNPPTGVGVPNAQGGAGTVQATPSAQNAFDAFRNSTNYNFQLGQGLDAVNSGYAGGGVLQSGAAMKGINDYAQNFAQGAYQGWLGNVSDIANRGFGAASAQAGVGQNYANSVSNLNSQNANALANAQLAKAQNTASALGGIGAIGANVIGSVLAPSPQTYGVQPNLNAFSGYRF